MNRVRLALWVLLAAVACARSDAPRVSLEPGARSPAPAFRLEGARRRPDAVVVEALGRYRAAAGGTPYWRLAALPRDSSGPPNRIRYGEAPAGYVAAAPAALLTPGRYRIDVRTGGRSAQAYFRVHPDGSITTEAALGW